MPVVEACPSPGTLVVIAYVFINPVSVVVKLRPPVPAPIPLKQHQRPHNIGLGRAGGEGCQPNDNGRVGASCSTWLSPHRHFLPWSPFSSPSGASLGMVKANCNRKWELADPRRRLGRRRLTPNRPPCASSAAIGDHGPLLGTWWNPARQGAFIAMLVVERRLGRTSPGLLVCLLESR